MLIPRRVINRPSRAIKMPTIANEPAIYWHQTVAIESLDMVGVGSPNSAKDHNADEENGMTSFIGSCWAIESQ